MDVQPWQQPIADERTDNSDDQVTYEAEAAASHDLTRQPASNDADHQYDDEAFIRLVHGFAPTVIRFPNAGRGELVPARRYPHSSGQKHSAGRCCRQIAADRWVISKQENDQHADEGASGKKDQTGDIAAGIIAQETKSLRAKITA
jgi:hypothetical protein